MVHTERRTSERITLDVPIQLERHRFPELMLTDISTTGARLICPKGEPLGEKISFYLPFPQKIKGLVLSGRVIWENEIQGHRYLGIHFESPDEVDRQILEAYIDYLKRDKVIKEAKKVINAYIDTFMMIFDLGLEVLKKELAKREKVRYLH
ncbi:PilZ domain-containing protein [Thermosulfuriphilus sp.]